MNAKPLPYLILVALSFMLATPAWSQDAPAKAAPTADEANTDEQEMIVNADSADVQLDEDNHPIAIELEGNVSIEDTTMRFTAKKMTVHLDKNNKPTNIEAVGGVMVRSLDGTGSASGETGRYDAEQDTVVLKGNCVILQEKNTIRGEQVVYDRKTGKIRLKGASLTLPLKKGEGGSGFGNLLKNPDKIKGEANKPKGENGKPKGEADKPKGEADKPKGEDKEKSEDK